MSETFGPQRKAVPDLEDMLKSTPLFMQSMDDATDNDTLAAIQSLIYDGTPEEMALNFKEQGNEAFQAGKSQYQSAVEFYSKGIAAKSSDAELNSVLHSNRAAVNLELGNFRKVLNDCSDAIKLNPKNVKAFYRSTKALYSLDRIAEARNACKLGLELDPTNKPLLTLSQQIEKRHESLTASKLAAQAREKAAKDHERLLWSTIASRNVTTVSALKPTDHKDEKKKSMAAPASLETHKPSLDPETNTLSYPVVFLYPEHTLSDYIAAFHEQDTFQDHLDEMFAPANRPPWDTTGAYTPDVLDVYFETRPDLDAEAKGKVYHADVNGKRKLMKVDPASQLGDVLASEAFRLVDGVASFFVLSRSSGAFLKHFRKQYK
ncbi:hypothetical protein HDU98_007852 [Podochytrium sp. JEL0797]|nr:hypothetical protein HDU98_007852 [Podochytrium sp. JEL0797]